jgi:phage-related protein
LDVLYYNGVHSIMFGDKHTWFDWHLVPLSKPVIPPPELVENFVDIPGANGQLDLTDVLNGFPTYKNRSGEFAFIIDPAYGYLDSVYPMIANTLHGRRTKVILTDDPDWYYEGRVVVSSAESSKDYSSISFACNLDHFKLTVNPIPGYEQIEVNGTKTLDGISFGYCPMRQIAKITATDVPLGGHIDATLTNVDGEMTGKIVEGSYRYPGLVFAPGSNTLVLNGTGTVTIELRGGSL